MKFNSKTLIKRDDKFELPDGYSLQFDIVESEHFLVMSSGKVRGKDTAELAERLWYGMNFQHPGFAEKWGDEKKAIFLCGEKTDYDILGKYFVDQLANSGRAQEASNSARTLPMSAGAGLTLDNDTCEKYNVMRGARALRADSKSIFQDQLDAVERSSKSKGFDYIDLSLLTDGLKSEREQGITIDVAHRYINYKTKRIVFHDSPGHFQYTSNVITAASNCDIAILLIDIKKGIAEQTKRHLKILEFLNIKNIIFAVNKIDLVQYNKRKFLTIKENLKNLVYYKATLKFIPVSALNGDNVVFKSKKTKWYNGKSILDTINSIKVFKTKFNKTCISIQNVHRPNRLIRNYQGDLKGSLKKSQKIKILPSGNITSVKNIYSNFKRVNKLLNSPVSLDLKDQFEISKGDIISDLGNKKILVGNAFNANVVITSSDKIIPGRQYFIRIHNKLSKITITKVKSVFDFKKGQYFNKNTLDINDIGIIEFTCNDDITFSIS